MSVLILLVSVSQLGVQLFTLWLVMAEAVSHHDDMQSATDRIDGLQRQTVDSLLLAAKQAGHRGDPHEH